MQFSHTKYVSDIVKLSTAESYVLPVMTNTMKALTCGMQRRQLSNHCIMTKAEKITDGTLEEDMVSLH